MSVGISIKSSLLGKIIKINLLEQRDQSQIPNAHKTVLIQPQHWYSCCSFSRPCRLSGKEVTFNSIKERISYFLFLFIWSLSPALLPSFFLSSFWPFSSGWKCYCLVSGPCWPWSLTQVRLFGKVSLASMGMIFSNTIVSIGEIDFHGEINPQKMTRRGMVVESGF